MLNTKVIAGVRLAKADSNLHYYEQIIVPMVIDAYKAQSQRTIEALTDIRSQNGVAFDAALREQDAGLTITGLELELAAVIQKMEENLRSDWHRDLARYYTPEFMLFRAELLMQHDFCGLYYKDKDHSRNLHDEGNGAWFANLTGTVAKSDIQQYEVAQQKIEHLFTKDSINSETLVYREDVASSDIAKLSEESVPDELIAILQQALITPAEKIKTLVSAMRSKHQRFESELLGHVPVVNMQASHLYTVLTDLTNLLGLISTVKEEHKGIFTLFGLDISENLKIAEVLTSPFMLTHSVPLLASLDSHDAGKFAPPNKDGVNNYGAHPWIGYGQLKAFLEKGHLILDPDTLPPGLISPEGIAFTPTEISQMITAIALHHLTSAGPGLGENGQEVNAELLLEPLLQDIFQDPVKRQWYFNLMTVVTICDIASLGFLSREKLEFYMGTPERLEGLLNQLQTGSLNLPVDANGKLQYGQLDKQALYAAMGITLEDEADRRLAGMLSANMANNVPQRETGFVIEEFEHALETAFQQSDIPGIRTRFQAFFTRVAKWEYGRNILQATLLTSGASYYNPKFEEQIQTIHNQADNFEFDSNGFHFMDRLMRDTESITRMLIDNGLNTDGDNVRLAENAPLFVRTGRTNSQFNYHNFVQWKQMVVTNEDWLNEFFEQDQDLLERKWVKVEFDQQYGTFRITYDFEGFMRSKGLRVSSK